MLSLSGTREKSCITQTSSSWQGITRWNKAEMWNKDSRLKLKILITIEVTLIATIILSSISLIKAGWTHSESPATRTPLPSRTPLQFAQNPVVPSITPSLTLPPGTPTQTLHPTNTPTATPAPLCHGPSQLLILALGIDNRWNSYYYGLADVIRVVRVDFLDGGVTVLTLPRDLWVEIPGLEDRDITHGKLNQAYLYGSEYLNYYQGPDLGPGLMLETLALNYDLEIDKYITLNMTTMEKVIDAAGGIDIYLPYDVNGVSEDPPVDLGYFEKGPQHFTGEKAVRFARVRMIDNDIQRSIRQSWVLEALWKKLISPDILPHIPDLVHALYGAVETNLKADNVRQLICLAPLIADQKIRFVSLPTELLVGDRIFVERYMKTVFYFNIDKKAMISLLADFQAGAWPPPEP